jgi:hypothetical protein
MTHKVVRPHCYKCAPSNWKAKAIPPMPTFLQDRIMTTPMVDPPVSPPPPTLTLNLGIPAQPTSQSAASPKPLSGGNVPPLTPTHLAEPMVHRSKTIVPKQSAVAESSRGKPTIPTHSVGTVSSKGRTGKQTSEGKSTTPKQTPKTTLKMSKTITKDFKDSPTQFSDTLPLLPKSRHNTIGPTLTWQTQTEGPSPHHTPALHNSSARMPLPRELGTAPPCQPHPWYTPQP